MVKQKIKTPPNIGVIKFCGNINLFFYNFFFILYLYINIMSYVDTEIIECTRQSSEQAKGDNRENPALFTNKLGNTLTLEVGDVVSVERSFINGLGSGNAKTIQFKGQHIKQIPPTLNTTPNKVKQIQYTELAHGYYQPNPLSTTQQYRMGYYLEHHNIERTENINLQDNKQVFTIGYYMNANQYPNYITLPRRFNGLRKGLDANVIMQSRDSHSFGMCEHSAQLECYLIDDWKEYIEGNGRTTTKQRIKNDRYTLMCRDRAYYDANIPNANTYLPATAELRLHPLYYPYQQYRERKEVEIDKGFNTPQEVADQITRYLNQSNEPETFRYKDSSNKIQVISNTITSECYKPFNVASCEEFSNDGYVLYVNPANVGDRSQTYFNSFYNIGVKRPELWLFGRSIPQNALGTDHFRGMTLTADVTKAGAPPKYFYTDMEYTRENVERWRDLFELQQNYPEFWNNLDETMYSQFNVSPKQGNTAMLHINKWGSVVGNMKPGGTIQSEFGDEGMEDSAAPVNLINKATLPLFIYYNRDEKDNYYEPPGPEDKWSCGWAKGYLDGGVWKIYFTNYESTNGEGVTDGGVPDPIFSEVGDTIKAGRYVGFDWNSTGYGNACIIPYAGYTWTSFLEQDPAKRYDIAVRNLANANATEIANVLTQSYIGAINPKCNFNELTNRFEFSELHTQQNVGNTWDAGDPLGFTSGSPENRPVNPNESKTCYKLNPFVNPWGYSPNFLPYTPTIEVNWVNPAIATARLFFKPNENIDPYAVFDAQTGFFFDDMGVHEREWDKTLWGIMGFSYNQFNAPLTSKNTLSTRVGFENKYLLNKPTTNAEINTTDSKTWVSNEFAAPQYTNQVPCPLRVQSWSAAKIPALIDSFTNYPAIISECESITLSAQNLSKQMLNPFYTIRSDIISDVKYLGGGDSGIQLPVIGIVDRYGAEGDFYFGNPSDINFTITKQTILSDITTAIHDPDGTFAVINENSGVIYKVQRQKPPPPRVIEEIIAEEKKKK